MIQTAPKKYKMTYDTYWFLSEDNTVGSRMGSFEIILKKANNRFGFNITNIKRLKAETYV